MSSRLAQMLLRTLGVAAALVLTSRAHAQQPPAGGAGGGGVAGAGDGSGPNLCIPGQPFAPGCLLAPPGQPPPVSPEEVAAHRARVEAEYRAKNGPSAYDSALRRRDEQYRQAWLARANDARPAAIPVRFPLIEATAAFRVGSVGVGSKLGESYGHAGPEVGFAFRFDRTFAIEVPVALMQTWAGALGHWATVATSPALVVGVTWKGGIGYLRAGPDILVPRGASGVAPDALVGAHVGYGVIGFVASLPNDGYVGIGFDARFSLRGGVGGPESVLDAPRIGFDGALVLRVAF